MDFSSELEIEGNAESPKSARKAVKPTRFLIFSDLLLQDKPELEQLLSPERPLSISYKNNGLLVELLNIHNAIDIIARLHQTSLKNGK